jgi:hypothetical protein
MVECRDRNICEDVKCEGADKYFIDDLGCFIEEEEVVMSKLIDSELMKGAVAELFNHELKANGKVSSHSQLERWIIKELDNYSPKNTVLALTLCLREMRGIELDMGDVDDDVALLKARYAEWSMYIADTGGGGMAFRFAPNDADDDHYALVTIQEGIDVPANLSEPVQFGWYNGHGDLLYHQEYVSSYGMFSDGFIKYMLGC